MKKAVVLLSGGVDSSTILAVAKSEGYDLFALSFNYGQRHKIEIESAKKVAKLFNVKNHMIIDINLREIGGSALTTETDVPKDRTEVTKQRKDSEIPATYVPARNTIILSFALGWAETIESADIFIGVNAIDYSGYPDCRPEFIKAFEEMANLATKVSVEGRIKFKIHTPLINLSKADIIKLGHKHGVDYSLTWSCYDPRFTNDKYFPCMKCDSCILRARGFKEAGIDDPLTAPTSKA